MSSLVKLYEDHFDADCYATAIGSQKYSSRIELQWSTEDFYHRVFSTGHVKGKTLLDVGSGPLIRGAISASKCINKIYLGELLESNRNILQKWLTKQQDAPDYTPQLHHVAQLEGHCDIRYLEDRVRKSIREVLYLNILSKNPLHPRYHCQFDVVVSSLCLDCFPDDRDYLEGMKNLANLIKPGGQLALVATVECTKYLVGKQSFPAAWVDEAKLCKALIDSDLDICELQEVRYKHPLPEGYDNKGFFYVIASKMQSL